MSTTDDAAPRDAAQGSSSPQTEPSASPAATVTPGAAAPPLDALSPAVRRLVRQFDLDITGIHGTGPEGRIRVGDVMGLLDGRTDTGNRDAPLRIAAPDEDELPDADAGEPDVGAAPETPLPWVDADASAPHSAVPTSSVFECDFSRVLSHRKRLRRENSELLTTTSYLLTALSSAIEATPELAADTPVRFGIWLATLDGELRRSLVDVPNPLPETLEDRARAFDGALRANLDADISSANLLVHAYGESGSLLTTPTPIGAGHVASIGIGRVRREVIVRLVDGVETPRVAARCYLSVSFFDERVGSHRANRALADTVRILETWPD